MLEKLLQDRILFLDGAMGTMIQSYSLKEQDYRKGHFEKHPQDLKGNHDLLCLTAPEVIEEIHNAYLAAGADIIETNTFNSTQIVQAQYGLQDEVYRLNKTAAQLAKKCADQFTQKTPQKPRVVAGILGPTHATASLSPDVNRPGYRAVDFDTLVLNYTEAVLGLMDGGSDCLMVETVFDTLNCKAALYAIENCFIQQNKRLPILISVTIVDASGRTLSGQTVQAFWNAIRHSKPLAVGINCALGPEALRPYIEELSKIASCFVSIHPNAGLPNPLGEYDETPEDMAKVLADFAQKGFVNMVGGCCGTTPKHIKTMSEAIKTLAPRQRPVISQKCRLSGLEPLEIGETTLFVNIGERTNVTGSSKFSQLILAGDYEAAVEVARQQVLAGAQIIDINMDEGMLDSEAAMSEFCRQIAAEPEISRVPVMVDSSKWSVIETGLKCLQGKGIVNSLSLKEGETIFKEQAKTVMRYGAAVVVMAFDEEGQADTYSRKIEICTRAYRILVEQVGFPAEDIIFDPNIFALATGINEHRRYGIDFIEAVRFIKQNLPYALVSGGVSNVSFSFRGMNAIREAIHCVFLYHAIAAGLSMGIVNAGQLSLYANLDAALRDAIENVLFDKNENAVENLVLLAQTFRGDDKAAEIIEIWREDTLENRLAYALVHGTDKFLEPDLTEALAQYGAALSIIEGPLMNGMNQVGDLFGSGQLFLPQVIKSARVMKKAVAFLTPVIEAAKQSGAVSKKGKILLATVKGDVHDIGKNIVSVVLQCNNFEVIDLGVMTPAEKIMQVARAQAVDFIGLSGLITPSLEEMSEIARKMQAAGFTTPLLIGGATTSKIHTAVKIAVHYAGATVYVPDASRAVVMATQLVSHAREGALAQIKTEYEAIRLKHAKTSSEAPRYSSLRQARENRVPIDWTTYVPPKPSFLGLKTLENYPLEKLVDFIDWTPFFQAWELKGKYPEILKNPETKNVALPLWEDAQKMLHKIVQQKLLKAEAVFGFFPAASHEEDVEVYDPDKKTKLASLHFLRQQMLKSQKPNFCLADFIAPKDDTIGLFFVTAGIGLDALVAEYEKQHDDYQSIIAKLLSDRLAEAFAEHLHLEVRKKYWGYAPFEKLNSEELISEKYQGIRPAPGYGACPEHSEKETIFKLLQIKERGIAALTENFAMLPTASVCGYYFSHPESQYFGVGKVDKDQVALYAQKKGFSVAEAEKWLAPVLAYEVGSA